jgi:nucleoside-diphosphate-sugar epimerase
MSRITVFGATGLTGRLVVKHALAQGHEVVALVRDPARLTASPPPLFRTRSGSSSKQCKAMAFPASFACPMSERATVEAGSPTVL